MKLEDRISIFGLPWRLKRGSNYYGGKVLACVRVQPEAEKASHCGYGPFPLPAYIAVVLDAHGHTLWHERKHKGHLPKSKVAHWDGTLAHSGNGVRLSSIAVSDASK